VDTGTVSNILYGNALTAPAFSVSLSFRMTPPLGAGADYGDGMAVAFLAASNTQFLGGNGGGMGILRLTGIGVEFDVFQNSCDPDANHVAIDLLSWCGPEQTPASYAWTLGLANTTTLADGTVHSAVLDVQNGFIQVTLDDNPLQFFMGPINDGVLDPTDDTAYDGGVPLISDAGVSPGEPFYLGLIGTTGAYTLETEIFNVSVIFPTPTCF
jgi:hypothetical protein